MRSMLRTRTLTALSATALALTLTSCGSDDDPGDKGTDTSTGTGGDTSASVKLPKLDGQTLEVAAVWTGPEQENFTKVLKEFEKRTGAKVNFVPTGNNTSTFLGTKIQGGKPPDVAFLPQVGVLHQFAEKGWLKPLGADAQAQLDKNFDAGWKDLGAFEGKQYGIYVKAANKSLVWYNTAAFEAAGLTEAPTTWKDFVAAAQTLSDAGSPPSPSAAPTAGPSPTGSRTSISRRRARRSTTSSPSTRSSGPIRPSRTP